MPTSTDAIRLACDTCDRCNFDGITEAELEACRAR
jgi:hypothetical protein